jgi:hypothetical protein
VSQLRLLYRAFASSSANALCGPPAPLRRSRRRVSLACAVAPAFAGGLEVVAAATTPPDAGAPSGAGRRMPPPCGGPVRRKSRGGRSGRSLLPIPGPPMGAPLGRLPLGGWAGFARRSLSSSGARSNRVMMDCISSLLGASIKAKPFDSCVSGLRMTLIWSATRFSAVSHDLISSEVTQAGKFPRKTVKLISWYLSLSFSLLVQAARQFLIGVCEDTTGQPWFAGS